MQSLENILRIADKTTLNTYNKPPFIIDRGEGAYLWDTQNKQYLDFATGLGVNVLGNNHPAIQDAILKQSQKIIHTSNLFYHKNYIEVCNRLTKISHGEQVFLTNSGCEANECALKLARRYFYMNGEKRNKIIAMKNAFHGRTLGTLSITGKKKFREGFNPLLKNISFADFGDITDIKQKIDHSTAAIILEPIQGNAGVILPPKNYLKEVEKLSKEYGCLLIIDEVQTGIGRCGFWFAHQKENIKPDIITVAKALGGGLPLGAMICSSKVGATLTPGTHGSTFGGNPIACSTSIACIDTIKSEKLLDNTHQMGIYLKEKLYQIKENTSYIKDIRGLGLIVGVEISLPLKKFVHDCLEHGLCVTSTGQNTIRLLPPLNITKKHINQAMDIFISVINQTKKK